MFAKIVFSIILLCVKVKSQLPPGFVCVPAGTCATTGSSTIDIRIVTPAAIVNPCPQGQVPCPAAPPGTTCGRRSVANVATGDGFATPGAWPWLAYIVNQTAFVGSGVLINSNTILTAAHKVVGNRATPSLIGVYMGVNDRAQLGTRYAVSAVTIHPNFNNATLFNDIAVLTLSAPISPLPQQFVNTACMPTQGQSFINQICSVAGWGQTSFTVIDAPTTRLKQVNVSIVNYNTCYTSMSNTSLLGANVNSYLDPFGEICAGGEAMRDACTQDGGSPLVCFVNNVYTIAGLVIWGKGCGQTGVYGVYVNVPYYVQWIQSVIANPSG